jgi:hypothetical protein
LDHPREAAEYGARGSELVRTMFDVERTARAVFDIYQFVLGATNKRPQEFDSRAYVNTVCPTESIER